MRIFLAVFLLLAAYFVIPVLMIWVPAFAIGCAWPEKVSEIIEHNASPDSIVAWWTRLVEWVGPVGWGLQLNPVGDSYAACVSNNWWDLIIITTGVVLPFMAFGVPLALLIGQIAAFLVRKML